MTLSVKKKYLVFPVNTAKEQATLTFSENGASRGSFRIRLDTKAPNFFAYLDVSRFIGHTLTLSIEPKMEISFREADTLEYMGKYQEPYRPQVHFTVKNGWLNDPNGLVRVGDTYHLFYQFTPTAPLAGSMHWGHATSRDLLHWREQDPALFPDETGDKWSGSAIVDLDNVSGLGEGDEPPVLLYYTATDPFAQYVAYSTDGLKTIKKYGTEPVVGHIMRQNRDPKVMFCEERGDYLMAIHLATPRFLLLCSRDLLHWKPLQELSLEGDGECPDLFPLCDQHGKRHWVFIGGRSRYLVGDVTADGFVPAQEPQSLYYGGVVQAGQTFSGLPDGRIVRIDWDRWLIDTPPFAGQMSIPYDLTLREQDGRYLLCAAPIRELETLFDGEIKKESLALSPDQAWQMSLEAKPYHLRLTAKCFAETRLALTIFGRTAVLDGRANTLTLGNTVAPLRRGGTGLNLCLILDRCSIEIFSDGGTVYLGGATPETVADPQRPSLILSTDTPCTVDVTLHSLRSIWE